MKRKERHQRGRIQHLCHTRKHSMMQFLNVLVECAAPSRIGLCETWGWAPHRQTANGTAISVGLSISRILRLSFTRLVQYNFNTLAAAPRVWLNVHCPPLHGTSQTIELKYIRGNQGRSLTLLGLHYIVTTGLSSPKLCRNLHQPFLCFSIPSQFSPTSQPVSMPSRLIIQKC